MNVKRLETVGLSLLLAALVAGCNPVSTGAKLGVKLVGEAIDDADVKERKEKLLGSPPAVADEMFGKRVNTFQEVNRNRQWLVYPVDMDVLKQYRYVLEVSNGKIVAITKAKKGGSKVDIPRRLILKDKAKGKSPKQCQTVLEMGPPLLTARNLNTKRLVQLYDGKALKLPGDPKYCIVRYDAKDLCEDLEFVEAQASTKKDPMRN